MSVGWLMAVRLSGDWGVVTVQATTAVSVMSVAAMVAPAVSSAMEETHCGHGHEAKQAD